MKFSLVTNDKSTFWDEVCLGIICLVCLGLGVFLIYARPSFWVIKASMSVTAGALLAAMGVMFVICLIYRLFTNDLKKENKA